MSSDVCRPGPACQLCAGECRSGVPRRLCRCGFGSRLIERTFPSAQGRVESAYLPTGLAFTLDAPLDALKDGDGENGKQG